MNTFRLTIFCLGLFTSFVLNSSNLLVPNKLNSTVKEYSTIGMSNAAVFIKLEDPNQYKIEDIVNELFGSLITITDKATNEFDFRNENSIIIAYHENGIRIMNSNFVNQILVERSKEVINKLNTLFNKPKLILTYMHYDSGDSFGFSLIENGQIKRFRYSLSTDWVTQEFGNPLDVELNILNGEIYYEENEYGERNYLYKRKDDINNPRSMHFINSELTNEVMLSKLGFGIEEMHSKIPVKFIIFEKRIK